MKREKIYSLPNWVIINQDRKTEICNYADNYYGDQRCYAIKNKPPRNHASN